MVGRFVLHSDSGQWSIQSAEVWHHCLISIAGRQERAYAPRVLVYDSNGNNIGMPSLTHPFNPLTSGIRLSTALCKNRYGAMDHERTQISIIAFTGSEQSELTSAGSLFGAEPLNLSNVLGYLVGPEEITCTTRVSNG